MSGSHAHAHHSHGFASGWAGWRSDPTRVAIVGLLAVLAVATCVAMAALWPDGSGRAAVLEEASEVGFAAEQVNATVASIVDDVCSFASADDPTRCRTLSFDVKGGPDDGERIALPEFSLEFDQTVPPVSVGDDVILNYEPQTGAYSYADQDRRTSLLVLAALFAVVVVALGRVRGLFALLSMVATVLVMLAFIAPSVLDGNDPLLVAVVGAGAIAFLSLFLTHGVTPSIAVALLSTIGALLLTLLVSSVFFALAGFTGLATEEATFLPLIADDIDLSALLLGGAVLGALGALDDVTVTQVATVEELHRQRPDLGWRGLMSSGIRVGRAHIGSTVNTLLLAYAGAGIPLLLLFAASNQSLDLVANSEAVAVEIVRTMCGSIGLVAAVPLATGLAAVIVTGGARGARPLDAPTSAPPQTRRSPAFEDFAPDREFWTDG